MMKKASLAIVWLLAGALALEAAWTTKRFTNTAEGSVLPDVAVYGSNVCVVWDEDNAEIYFRKSTDAGVTWQTVKKLSNNAGRSYSSEMAVSGSNIYVVWNDETPGNGEIFFRKSADGGATWLTRIRLTNNTLASYSPHIAVNGLNVYVVWHDNKPGNPEIYFRKSTDGGATWQTAKRLTNNTGDSYSPRIAVSGSNIYVVWHDNTPGAEEVYFKKSADDGASWQTVQNLSNNAGISYMPRLAVNGSNVYVVWADDVTGNLETYFRKSTDGGTTWKATKRLTFNSGKSFPPDIAVNGSYIYVVWHDNTPGNYEIYSRHSANGGATWQTAERITTKTGSSWWPAISLSSSKVYIVWQDDNPENWEIFLSYAPGSWL